MKTLLSNESKLLLSLMVAPVLVMGCGDAVTQSTQVADAISTSPELDENSGESIVRKLVDESVIADGSETVEAPAVTDDSALPDDIDLATYHLLKVASEGW